MAVSKVKVISIIGVLKALDEVVKICGKSEVFHPESVLSFYSNVENFLPIPGTSPYKEPLKKLKSVISKTNIKLEMVKDRDFEVNKKEINDYVDYFCTKLEDYLSTKEKIIEKIHNQKNSLNDISHFIGLDLNLSEIFACRYIKVRFGKLPKESYLKLSVYKDDPYMLFCPCTSDEEFCWGVYFAPLENISDIDRKFSSLYFERLWINETDGTPESKWEYLKQSIEKEEVKLAEIEKKIENFWKSQKDQCMRFYTKLEEMNTYFGIKKYASKYNDSFILMGWIPEENEKELVEKLSKVYGIEYSVEKADNEIKHSPPVKLKNNKFSRPFEMFVDMYGLPSYNEIDPTVLVSIVYTVLFGIMFGDVGQGIILSIAGAIMYKLKGMTLGKVLIRCGISASLFGLLFGSVFGFEHLLDPFYKMLFNLDEKPIEVMKPNTVMLIMLASIGLGVIIITVSMILNIYSSFRRRDYESAMFGQNGLAGLIFYSSIVVMAVCVLLNINIVNNFYIIMLIVLPLLIIFFKEPLGAIVSKKAHVWPEKWGEFILQNFFEVFEILLSYLTNTMSFLRVGAYSLGHAGMMFAVFTMAEVFGKGSPFVYGLVILIGNIFVIVLEGLLVNIQVLRLNFYEMFSRFFEGQGKAFSPVLVREDSKIN